MDRRDVLKNGAAVVAGGAASMLTPGRAETAQALASVRSGNAGRSFKAWVRSGTQIRMEDSAIASARSSLGLDPDRSHTVLLLDGRRGSRADRAESTEDHRPRRHRHRRGDWHAGQTRQGRRPRHRRQYAAVWYLLPLPAGPLRHVRSEGDGTRADRRACGRHKGGRPQ